MATVNLFSKAEVTLSHLSEAQAFSRKKQWDIFPEDEVSGA
jgi:hypothetical protein